ncbi:hypothetical protein [Candidatus Amarolinea aalborgensis]|jgi:predicted nucleic acid-binding protein|uniref:hypothetical protein n=1 Tax=Candidatus Amarolinea aalborgensis TaxID=2249329 RepID=UPI003BFA018E
MVVSDTNILTSFAAARALDLLLKALSVQTIFIPPAVKREIEAGLARHVRHLQPVLDMMTQGFIGVLDLESEDQARLALLPPSFGPGEREAVALCQRLGAILLCNDHQVLRYCAHQTILALDLPTLLRLLWLNGLVSQATVRTMIVRMEKIEHLVLRNADRIFTPRTALE